MKVGIIGYKGFVGSAFFRVFSSASGYNVTGISRKNYIEHVGKEFDILINANGNSSKLLAEKDPQKDFEANVSNTMRFLEDFNCKHYIHISSTEVYQHLGQETTREDVPIALNRLSNYGFSKCLGELVVMKHAKSWLVLRLAGMVGHNMKKGPAYDILKLGKLFVSSKSEYQFINTDKVAEIALKLSELNKWGQIYNVVGDGAISLARFAKMAGVKLSSEGTDIRKFNVSVEKLKREMPVPTSEETVMGVVKSYWHG